MTYKIKVNGIDRTADVDADTPLLWVLRDVLGMTGTKFGCGMALCGACTVHLDGSPVRSCVTPIENVGASAITTIEAIGDTPAAKGFRRRGSISKSSSAAIANPVRSCPRRLSSQAIRIPQIARSTTRCPATFAAAALMFASAKRSSRPRNSATTNREAEHAPRSIFRKC